MILRKMTLVALGLATSAATTALTAAPTAPIQRFGRVFGYSVCGTAAPIGYARCHAKVVTDQRGMIIDGKPNPAAGRLALPSGYGPADLRAAYNLGAAPAANTIPNGKTIAIVDAYGYTNAEQDLAIYRNQYGLPPCTRANGCLKIVNQTGGTSLPRQDLGWAQEQALDLDMVSAGCPTCKIILVQTASNSLANLGAGVNTAVRLGAYAVSNSYGGSEYSSENNDDAAYYKHPGVAITASSGDSGYGSSFPAASQYVTAVGGTSLNRVSGGFTESAWNGAGSGCSTYVAKPSWQKDTGCTKRSIADVSAVADPNTGVAVYGPNSRRGSTWMVFGGTSASAPLIAAIYGLNGNAGGAVANYGADPYATLSGLKDVTSGKNGTCSTYFCNAGPGYDGPTGLGTPNGISAF